MHASKAIIEFITTIQLNPLMVHPGILIIVGIITLFYYVHACGVVNHFFKGLYQHIPDQPPHRIDT